MDFVDRWLRKIAGEPEPMRGRVHKVSVVAGGEVSIVVRFGLDEPRARDLNQGALLEVVVAPPAVRSAGEAHQAAYRKPAALLADEEKTQKDTPGDA